MPIKQCKTKNGKSGWTWGNSLPCYINKADLIKQVRAIFASGYKSKGSELTDDELIEFFDKYYNENTKQFSTRAINSNVVLKTLSELLKRRIQE